jgi:cytochrome c oxidase subunit III
VVEAAWAGEPLAVGAPLPVGALGRNAVGWWGMLCLIATESSLFAYLLFSYFYFAAQNGKAWLPVAHPQWRLSGPDTLVLLASSVAIWWAERAIKRGARRRHLAGTAIAIALGVVFLVVQYFEWRGKSFTLTSGSYGSLYFTITGFHMAHVVAGLIMLSVVFAWSLAGDFNERRHTPVMMSSVYWHFVDAVWLVVFFTFYVSPYLW